MQLFILYYICLGLFDFVLHLPLLISQHRFISKIAFVSFLISLGYVLGVLLVRLHHLLLMLLDHFL